MPASTTRRMSGLTITVSVACAFSRLSSLSGSKRENCRCQASRRRRAARVAAAACAGSMSATITVHRDPKQANSSRCSVGAATVALMTGWSSRCSRCRRSSAEFDDDVPVLERLVDPELPVVTVGLDATVVADAVVDVPPASAGSWPETRTSVIISQAATNSATAPAMTRRRIVRARAVRAFRSAFARARAAAAALVSVMVVYLVFDV